MRLTHGSLFSGIGGFELGAKNVGIETIWSCECEEHNRKVLARHFPQTRQYEDVRTFGNYEYVDIISGGFPCQDISVSGKGGGLNGERSGLWFEMWRIINGVRPKYVIIENSPRLVVLGLKTILECFAGIGYNVEWQCLYATQFGYSHYRKRIYIVAYSMQNRPYRNVFKPFKLSEILQKQASRQIANPIKIKRFHGESDFEDVRMDDGFSKKLDRQGIEMMGNAVIPEIAEYLFKCIIDHNGEAK